MRDTLMAMRYALPALFCMIAATGCHGSKPPEPTPSPVAYFQADPATAASITGTVYFRGSVPAPTKIDMSEDPACVAAHQAAHHGTPHDESLTLGTNGTIANAFVYLKTGLEGKVFETPTIPVTIVQSGCWFSPHVFGLQTGQPMQVVNADPVTHNIHPLAQINRAWNHSQGPGDPPITRRFTKPEVMVSIKCNIHSWMHAYVGVLPHPYFAVTKVDGSFTIPDLPPGTYTLSVWQEKLGTQDHTITVAAHQSVTADFIYKGN